jgi:serine/threonine protein kinase
MPFCKNCGNNLENDAKFCPECGTPVTRRKKNISKHSDITNNQDDFKTQVRNAPSAYGTVTLENLPAGYIIDERYEVKEKIGQGGFGAVYRVFDRNMEVDKALKVIPEVIVSDKEAMFDLQKEAKTMISLNHANIVRVYDFHQSGSIKYIDMEYVDGKTLTEVKLDYPNKQVPEAKVKELAVKIADGLAYAHSKGVIHKDIKPQNVMLTKDGDVKIMDFGIAETVRTSMSRIQNTTSSGTLVYMSPEQIRGKDVGKESDIYSFGAMLYELLSGHPPFYKGAIEYQILNDKPQTLEHVSARMNELLQKCLEKDYKKRFKNFKKVRQIINEKKETSFNDEKNNSELDLNKVRNKEANNKSTNKKKQRNYVNKVFLNSLIIFIGWCTSLIFYELSSIFYIDIIIIGALSFLISLFIILALKRFFSILSNISIIFIFFIWFVGLFFIWSLQSFYVLTIFIMNILITQLIIKKYVKLSYKNIIFITTSWAGLIFAGLLVFNGIVSILFTNIGWYIFFHVIYVKEEKLRIKNLEYEKLHKNINKYNNNKNDKDMKSVTL